HGPESVELRLARLSVGAEYLAEAGCQSLATEAPANQIADRAHQQFLQQHRAVGFRKQAAVEQAQAADARLALQIPRQQFLGDAVAIVMGEDVIAAHTQLRQQRLLDVRLLQQTVGVPPRLGGKAE